MIPIARTQPAPRVLQRGGTTRTVLDCASNDAGVRDFEYSSSIYSHPAVRALLRRDQHNKCAYCETKLVRQRGRIDHYRPKDGVKRSRGGTMRKPGYYWLSYTWENLLLTCENCNDQGYKGNLFPLRIEARRARDHHAPITAEYPLIIDPTQVDPTRHIPFRREFAYAKRQSRKGRKTIEIFELNDDPDLVEACRTLHGRLERLQALAVLRTGILRSLASTEPSHENYSILQELLIESDEARLELDRAVLDDAPYAGMARAFMGLN